MSTITDAATYPTWSCYRGEPDSTEFFPENFVINQKIAHWHGDMTKIRIDAIVNAANNSLLGGGGIDGAIHRAAGRQLFNYCDRLNGCNTGDAKLSPGFLLPAKHIIHTVGPVGENASKLASCYTRSMEIARDTRDDAGNQLIRQICFCCISTGVYGYPNKKAAKVALKTVRSWLESSSDNMNSLDLIMFCTFTETDRDIYEDYLPKVFPRCAREDGSDGKQQETVVQSSSTSSVCIEPSSVASSNHDNDDSSAKTTEQTMFQEKDVDFIHDYPSAKSFEGDSKK